jgi:hypothetical protein
MPAKDTSQEDETTQKLPKVESASSREQLKAIHDHLHAHGNANVVEIRQALIMLLEYLMGEK